MNIDTDDYDGEWFCRFKSLPSDTPFAITYPNFSMLTSRYDGDVKSLYNFLLSKVDVIKKLPAHKETTGLSSDKISTRWDKYNLFNTFANKELDKLKKHVIMNYSKYCFRCGVSPEKIMIHAWYNVIEHGDCISEHAHEYGTMSYLSANVYLGGDDGDEPSSTRYLIMNRDENLYMRNRDGDLTMFPSYVPHATSVYTGTTPRVSIGINIFPARYYSMYNENEEHEWMKYIEMEN